MLRAWKGLCVLNHIWLPASDEIPSIPYEYLGGCKADVNVKWGRTLDEQLRELGGENHIGSFFPPLSLPPASGASQTSPV